MHAITDRHQSRWRGVVYCIVAAQLAVLSGTILRVLLSFVLAHFTGAMPIIPLFVPFVLLWSFVVVNFSVFFLGIPFYRASRRGMTLRLGMALIASGFVITALPVWLYSGSYHMVVAGLTGAIYAACFVVIVRMMEVAAAHW